MDTKELIKEFTVNKGVDEVFATFFGEEIYKKWSKAFTEETIINGDFKEGSDIEFLDRDGNGIGGKVSKVEKNKIIEFLYSYEVMGGKKNYLEGSHFNETYNFKDDNGKTVVKVQMTFPKQYYDEMSKMWDKAVEILQNIYK